MTRIERRLMIQSVALGAAVTVAIVLLSMLNGLAALERWLYDQRARHFQIFSPQPTDRLVHLDIDDRSLDGNSWPWRRATMALIVDEVHRAGAKAMAFDVFFSEASRYPLEQGEIVDDDGRFAQALQRFGDGMLPVAFMPRPQVGQIKQAMIAVLERDLELTLEEVQARLQEKMPGQTLEVNDYLSARRIAMFNRVTGAIRDADYDLPGLRAALLPRTDAMLSGAPILRLLEEQFDKAVAMKLLDRHAVAKPPGLPPVLSVVGELPPIPVLARVTAGTGFVDYLSDPDGVVRSVPLWVEYQDRLYPQLGLALACRAMDVDVRTLQLQADSVVIPRPGQEAIVIPVRQYDSARVGRFGMVVDVPWTGPVDNWEVIYDKPRYRESRQHLPASKVLEITRNAQNIVRNNATGDEALMALLSVLAPEKLAAFKANRPAPDDFVGRLELIRFVLHDAGPMIDLIKQAAPAELDDDSRIFLRSWQALRLVQEQNTRLSEQLATERQWLREQLEGRSVLMGWIATGKVDFNTTSLHAACPGVVIHGLIFNAIMTNDFVVAAPRWINLLTVLLVGGLTTLLAAIMSPARALGGAITLAGAYLTFNGLVIYDYANTIVWAGAPLTAVIAVWSGCTLQRFVVERRERARIIRRFQTYVDPALVRYVLENPTQARLDGQMRELTVVFTDLAGFTTLSEQLREKSVPLLNEYMGLMVPAIRQRNGYLNKFLGDGIMFFFGAPWENAAHARDAVTTVLDMHQIMESFNVRLKERSLPLVSMRAGISTGQMVVGDAGSIGQAGPNSASDYTVLGDAVNLAARLESANKAVGTRTLVTARTVELIEPGLFLFRPIARVQVVGKEEAVMVYEPMALMNQATDVQKNIADLCATVVDLFVAARFDTCLQTLRDLQDLTGPTKLITLYERACLRCMEELPQKFDGRIELTEK